MFSIKYIKAEPTTFIMQYKGGKLKRAGKGLSFFYYAPTTSLVAIPTGTTDLPFMLKENTKDYQEVTVQGQIIYRISEPEKISSLINFTLQPDAKRYSSEDPKKLNNRIINSVKVKMRAAIEKLELRQAIGASQALEKLVKQELTQAESLSALGLEVVDVAILEIKPTPETARALEAKVRELLLEEADEAMYRRRNASIDQERSVKENELKTELAVEAKQQEIQERKLEAKRILQEKANQTEKEKLEADVQRESQRRELVELATDNARKTADASAYEIAANMKALSTVDARVLEALTLANLEPEQMVAQAFRELAGGADRIGQLNISPDLLQQLSSGFDKARQVKNGKR